MFTEGKKRGGADVPAMQLVIHALILRIFFSHFDRLPIFFKLPHEPLTFCYLKVSHGVVILGSTMPANRIIISSQRNKFKLNYFKENCLSECAMMFRSLFHGKKKNLHGLDFFL